MRLKSLISGFRVETALKTICLLLTVCSILTAYIWTYQQDIVISTDQKLYESYLDRYKSQRDYVDKLFVAQRYSEAAVQAEIALGEMSLIGIRDKSYSIKRKLLLTLIRSRIQLGMPDVREALPYAEHWARSSERDLIAIRSYINVLKAIPGKNEDLQEARNLLALRFPGKSE